MSTPQFRLLLPDDTRLHRLKTLRTAVEPVLASNYLAHFTDHSVSHSDHLCDLVDLLAKPLDGTRLLTSVEAAILYSTCYLHDVGMQHARAGGTAVIQQFLTSEPRFKGRSWDSLEMATKQDIVRSQHNLISEEMVRSAIRAGDPAIGFTLNDDDHPGIVAALCGAHCIPTDHDDYKNRTSDYGGIRVGLLSALLRLADILDESRRRSRLFLEKTRTLSLESRLHWWRHYYVADVQVEPNSKSISVWFDFPVDRRKQYKELIEPLQMPWLKSEFERHSAVLAANNLLWHIQSLDTPEAHSVAQAMDDQLEKHTAELAARRKADQLREQRMATVNALRAARPSIARQFAALSDSTRDPDDQLRAATELAEHLHNLGGRRDAWVSLLSEFNRSSVRASEPMRLLTALRTAELMIADNASDSALAHIQPFVAHFEKLPSEDPMKIRFLRDWAALLRDRCAYLEAVVAYEKLALVCTDSNERLSAFADVAEMQFLQGELDKITDGAES